MRQFRCISSKDHKYDQQIYQDLIILIVLMIKLVVCVVVVMS